MKSWKSQLKPIFFVATLLGMVLVLPEGAVDSWSLFHPKELVKIILAMALLQFFGAGVIHRVGTRLGSRLTGFLGGLISSTATTVLIAKRSNALPLSEVPLAIVSILSSTIGMLLEVAVIVIVGTQNTHPSVLLVIAIPFLVTEWSIYRLFRQTQNHSEPVVDSEFRVWPILKLSGLILAVLVLSKLVQIFIGKRGLWLLTFVISWFEIHGSVVANVELFQNGIFTVKWLAGLLALSMSASYFSKMVLLWSLGSRELARQFFKYFLALQISLILGLGGFYMNLLFH